MSPEEPLDRMLKDLAEDGRVEDAAPDRRRFGKFLLMEELGRGGAGVVFRAWQADLQRWVAVKKLELSNPAARQRFVREARMAARLEHPNIVRVHEAGEIDGQPYIAMEWVEGTTLDRAGLPLEDVLRVMAQVARGVEAAHRLGIVHRDLKPSNILVSARGEGLVADFGLARPVETPDALTLSGAVMGTPSYMAPEQARGDLDRIDARTDVWGLGATLYDLVTGHPPFEGASYVEIIQRAATGEVTPPRRHDARISRELELILLKAMSLEPKRRYASADALADDLERYLSSEPIEARPSSLTYRLSKRVRRNPWAWGVGVGAAAVIIAGLIAAAFLWYKAAVRSAAASLAHEGALAYAGGDFDLAEERFREARARMPDHPDALFWEGRLMLREYQRRRGLPEARVSGPTVVVVDPLPETPEDRLLRERIRDRFEDSTAEPLAEGILDLWEGRHAQARQVLQRVAPKSPAGWEAGFYTACAYYLEGNLEAAAEEGHRHKGRAMGDPEIVAPVLGRIFLARGMWEHQRGQDPTSWYKEALAMAESLEETSVADAGRKLAAETLIEWGFWEEMHEADRDRAYRNAMERYDEALRRIEGIPHWSRGRALWMITKVREYRGEQVMSLYDEAIEAYSAAIRASGSRGVEYYWRGAGYWARSEYKERIGLPAEEDLRLAAGDIRRALELSPDDVDAELLLAMAKGGLARLTARTTRDLEEAYRSQIESLRNLTGHFPEHYFPHLYLGHFRQLLAALLVQEGRPDEEVYRGALSAFQRAAELNPADNSVLSACGTARTNLARFLGPRNPESATLLEDAIRDFEAVNAIGQSRSSGYLGLGRVHATAAAHRTARDEDPWPDFRKSLEAYSRAIEMDANDPNPLLERARVHEAMARQLQAKGGDPATEFRAAVQDLRTMLGINATRTDGWKALVEILPAMEAAEALEAIDGLEEAVRLDPAREAWLRSVLDELRRRAAVESEY